MFKKLIRDRIVWRRKSDPQCLKKNKTGPHSLKNKYGSEDEDEDDEEDDDDNDEEEDEDEEEENDEDDDEE